MLYHIAYCDAQFAKSDSCGDLEDPAGLRFRLHDRRLSGTPDIVFPKYRAVILVHGCFWHGHDCRLFKTPSTRTAFWTDNILSNRQRDARVVGELISAGWRVLTVWECALKGPNRLPLPKVIERSSAFVGSTTPIELLCGN